LRRYSKSIQTVQENRVKSLSLIRKSIKAFKQFRPSEILFALANGKLYFEFLKIFSVPENHLPLQGAKTLPKSAFLIESLMYNLTT